MSAIGFLIILLLIASSLGIILIKKYRRRSDYNNHASLAIRIASSLHHAITFIVIAAMVIIALTPSDTLGLTVITQSGLIISAIITSAILVPATIAISAATNANIMVIRWLIIGILWLVSAWILFLHASAWINVFTAVSVKSATII